MRYNYNHLLALEAMMHQLYIRDQVDIAFGKLPTTMIPANTKELMIADIVTKRPKRTAVNQLTKLAIIEQYLNEKISVLSTSQTPDNLYIRLLLDGQVIHIPTKKQAYDDLSLGWALRSGYTFREEIGEFLEIKTPNGIVRQLIDNKCQCHDFYSTSYCRHIPLLKAYLKHRHLFVQGN